MKRCLTLLLISLLLLTALVGCGQGEAQADTRLWFLSRSEEGVLALGQADYTGPRTAEDILAAQLAGPGVGLGLTTPFPAGTRLLNCRQEGNMVAVDLSVEYNGLSGLDRTLADYCVTLSLTQLDGVERVRITVEGWGSRVLSRADLVLSGAEEDPVERTVSLCFRRTGGNELGVELRVFRLTESQSAPMAVLQALLAGPEEPGLTALLPREVAVYSARVEAGICYADFSAALLDHIPPTREEQTLVVRSVAQSLCSLGYVQGVQLLVEGEPLTHYGALDVSQPLS